MDGNSLDIQQSQLEKLKNSFPELFSENQLDWEKMKTTFSKDINFSSERYVLNWAGKSDAFTTLQATTTATLMPELQESVDFENAENIFIEGENLEVLKVLQKSYYGKIKVIIIDPPYNTGNDSFIYPDKFSEKKETYLKRVGDKDETGNVLKDSLYRKNNRENGHFHSNWMNMMYPRLFLARNLLHEDGVIFVHIDDYEVYNLRTLMNEIFGEENFICQFIWNKQHSQQQGLFKKYHEYVLLYAKNETKHKNISGGNGVIDAGALKKISKANPASDFHFPAGVRFEAKEGTVLEGTFGDAEKVTVKEGQLTCKNGKTKEAVTLSAGWTQKNQMTKYFAQEKDGEIFDSKGQKVLEFYFNSTGKLKCLKERSKITPSTLLPEYGMVSEQTAHIADFFGKPVFDNPKPVDLEKDLIEWFAQDGDIILDFFGGSGTVAESVMKSSLNLRFIVVQIPEAIDTSSESGKNALSLGYTTIADIAKDRIRKVITVTREKEPEKTGLNFKAFKLVPSNFKIWRGDNIFEETLTKQLEVFVNPLEVSGTPKNIFYELLLKAGYLLSDPFHFSNGFYSVKDGELIVVLEKIDTPVIKNIITAHPKKVIVLDILFAGNDQLKTNTALQLKEEGIDFKTI